MKVLAVSNLELGPLAGYFMSFPFPYSLHPVQASPNTPITIHPTLTPEEEKAEVPHGAVFLSFEEGTSSSVLGFSVNRMCGKRGGVEPELLNATRARQPFLLNCLPLNEDSMANP